MQRKIEGIPLHHLWSVSSQRSQGKRCQINPSCCNRAQQKHVILERADHKPRRKKVIYCGEERSKNGCELVHVTEQDCLLEYMSAKKNQHAWSNMSMKSVWWVKTQRKKKHAESLWLNHSVIIGFPLTKCQSRFVSVSHCSMFVSVVLMPGISQHSVCYNQCNGTGQKDHKRTQTSTESQTEKLHISLEKFSHSMTANIGY